MLNQIFAENNPQLFDHEHAPGTADEEAFTGAQKALIVARGKFLATYKANIDKDGASPLPQRVFATYALPEASVNAATVRMIVDHTADIDIPDAMRYRVVQIDGEWRVQVAATLANKFPGDTAKAMHALAASFQGLAAVYDETGNDITSTKLTTRDAVVASLNARIATVDAANKDAFPPAIVLLPNETFDITQRLGAQFACGMDANVQRSGWPTRFVKSDSAKPTEQGDLFRQADVRPFLGKRIRLSAYLKSQDLTNWAGLGMVVLTGNRWDRFDTTSNQLLDKTSNRPIFGTMDWTKMEIVTDIPKTATRMMIGMQMKGAGQLWLDGAQIEVVGDDVAVTDDRTPHLYSDYAPKYSLAMDPDTQREGHPTICVTSHDPPASAHSWFGVEDRDPSALAGHRVRLSAWMKSSGGGSEHLSLVAALPKVPDKEIDNEAGKMAHPLSGQWRKYEVTGVVPAAAQGLVQGIFIFGNAEKVWIDDMKVEITDGAKSK